MTRSRHHFWWFRLLLFFSFKLTANKVKKELFVFRRQNEKIVWRHHYKVRTLITSIALNTRKASLNVEPVCNRSIVSSFLLICSAREAQSLQSRPVCFSLLSQIVTRHVIDQFPRALDNANVTFNENEENVVLYWSLLFTSDQLKDFQFQQNLLAKTTVGLLD